MKANPKAAIPRRREVAPATPLAASPLRAVTVASENQLEHRNDDAQTWDSDLNNLLVSTNIGMVLLDRRTCIRRFTPAATSLFGFLHADIGRPIRDLSPKFTDPSFLSDVLLVLDGGDATKKEVLSHEGRWFLRQTLPYRLTDGTIEGAVITFSDVAADALQEARLYASSIVNSVRDPLIVVDGELRIHSINQPFSDLFRVSADEVLGRELREVCSRVWDVKELLHLLQGVLENGDSIDVFEIGYESAALGSRALLMNARALHRGHGRPDLILLAIDDVTEQRRIEALLQENEARRHQEERVRQRQIDLSNSLRVSTVGELATGLAHELNQPLSSISNVVEACTRSVRAGTIEQAKILELLASIASETMRAAGIVAHLRSFVDKGEPQMEEVDLVEVVRHVPHLLLLDFERSRVSLRTALANDPLRVRADSIQIEQVIVNLLQNAIDSIHEAEATERVIELSASRRNGNAEISVRDTGTGVSASAAERMFEPFFTTKKQGLGMGLALSRSVLESHRGRIWMEDPSDGGAGIIVRFSLPLHIKKRKSPASVKNAVPKPVAAPRRKRRRPPAGANA
ncbi:MAG: PAS domain-containing protein [Candidatus Binatia bacterium]